MLKKRSLTKMIYIYLLSLPDIIINKTANICRLERKVKHFNVAGPTIRILMLLGQWV